MKNWCYLHDYVSLSKVTKKMEWPINTDGSDSKVSLE
jgi:hypothetical protein